MRALEKYNCKNLVIAGGVSANQGLRKRMQELCMQNNVELIVPAFKYCTDNATMIGAAGYYAYKLGRCADLDLNATSRDEIY